MSRGAGPDPGGPFATGEGPGGEGGTLVRFDEVHAYDGRSTGDVAGLLEQARGIGVRASVVRQRPRPSPAGD